MTVRQEVDRFRREQRQAITQTTAGVLDVWRRVDRNDVIGSWGRLLPEAFALVEAGQQTAARSGAAYSTAVIAAQTVPQPVGQVQSASLSGVASDGRPLENLLSLPAHQTVGRIGNGQPAGEALTSGRRQLGRLVVTQVADAGRQAASVGMVQDRSVSGYRRQISPPACARCAVLAGKWFRWNAGFQRHPSCECVHVPAVGPKADAAGLESFDPSAYFESLDAVQQDRIFTKAGAEAIRDGADMAQVVNARRGMRSTSAYGQKVSTTLVGTRSPGVRNTSFLRAMRAETGPQTNVRLMPEQIYRDANGNRELAIRLLGRFGYLG